MRQLIYDKFFFHDPDDMIPDTTVYPSGSHATFI